MKFRSWINKQLFLLALTACFLYFAAPATDIVTIYALELMGGRLDVLTVDRDIGPPVHVNMDSLSLDRKSIITQAQSYLGTLYIYGGNSREGIDCSGLVQQVFRQQEINLPRTVSRQFRTGTPIKKNELLPGDLIFFHTDFRRPGPTHVGIYVGNHHFLHSPKTGSVVKTSSIDRPYYRRRYMGARRVVQEL